MRKARSVSRCPNRYSQSPSRDLSRSRARFRVHSRARSPLRRSMESTSRARVRSRSPVRRKVEEVTRVRATHRDHVVEDNSLPGYEDYARRDSMPSIEAVSVGIKSGAMKVSKSLCKEIKGWLVTPLANKKAKDMADTFEVEFLEDDLDLRNPVMDGKITRRLKRLKRDAAVKSMESTDKMWRDIQAKLLDLSKSLLSSKPV